jgi:hypothetical protein
MLPWSEESSPTRRREVADIVCLHCARVCGVLPLGPGSGLLPERFHSDEADGCDAWRTLAGIRCAHCRGPVYLDAPRLVFEHEPMQPIPPARRGRPPKAR